MVPIGPPSPGATPRRRSLRNSLYAPSSIRALLASNRGVMQHRFEQMEDEDLDDGQMSSQLRRDSLRLTSQLSSMAMVRELNKVQIAKRGGGYRSLHVREKLLLRSLMRAPEERTDEDVELLIRATADVEFFQHLTKQQHSAVCREMTYQIVKDGTTLFEQGDAGSTFYIIYRGCCKLYATDKNLNWMRTCLCTLEAGASFGELALISGGSRSATAVASTPTIFFKVCTLGGKTTKPCIVRCFDHDFTQPSVIPS
jgi:hypothetical protein